MAISTFDLFKIGIGPSSSHTVGPMWAAYRFAQNLEKEKLLNLTSSIKVELFGSLGATGRGHGSDKAVIFGLQGETPDVIDPQTISKRLEVIQKNNQISILGKHTIDFRDRKQIIFHKKKMLPVHSNGMRFSAYDRNANELISKIFYSIGGGFIIDDSAQDVDRIKEDSTPLPFAFKSAKDLLLLCKSNNFSISQLMLENEKTWRSTKDIRLGLITIWKVMQECVQHGCQNDGILPGGLKVKRRAAKLYSSLTKKSKDSNTDQLIIMDWVNLYALAINEENAAGGRVVTAPTNGAAGIIPAVLHYCDRFCEGCSEEKIVNFFLTSAAIGILYKENASISGADVGCQGEVGVACSMAAGALTEYLGGTPEQVENAAEIAMEHNLGLTCDPVGGLVQIPCIERNAMASVQAINAARMALRGDGHHYVSLDKVIKTMRETGADMKTKYKETARGGLAVNVIEC